MKIVRESFTVSWSGSKRARLYTVYRCSVATPLWRDEGVSSSVWRSLSVVRFVPLLSLSTTWRQATACLDLYPGSTKKPATEVKPWLLNVRREIGIFILNWFHALMSCSCSPNIQVWIVSVYKQADGHRIGHATYHMPSFNRRCIVIERGSIFLTASVCSYERFGSIALLSYRICPFFRVIWK